MDAAKRRPIEPALIELKHFVCALLTRCFPNETKLGSLRQPDFGRRSASLRDLAFALQCRFPLFGSDGDLLPGIPSI